MSGSQSDRATDRERDLRVSVLNRLKDHTELVALLETADSVDDGTDAIRPAPRVAVAHQSAGGDPPEVVLVADVITGSSERDNLHEQVNLVVQTTLQLTERAFKWMGDAWRDDVKDEVSAVLTSNAPGWVARGASGGTFSPMWDEEINRYVTVQQFDVESRV